MYTAHAETCIPCPTLACNKCVLRSVGFSSVVTSFWLVLLQTHSRKTGSLRGCGVSTLFCCLVPVEPSSKWRGVNFIEVELGDNCWNRDRIWELVEVSLRVSFSGTVKLEKCALGVCENVDCRKTKKWLICVNDDWSVATNSKHWFTTSFLQPLPYLVTP